MKEQSIDGSARAMRGTHGGLSRNRRQRRENSMRQPHGLRYALLGVVSRSPRGIHGYSLRRKCERTLGGFWQLNFGEVYRLLDRLEEENLIEQVSRGDSGTRKVYRITGRGGRVSTRSTGSTERRTSPAPARASREAALQRSGAIARDNGVDPASARSLPSRTPTGRCGACEGAAYHRY